MTTKVMGEEMVEGPKKEIVKLPAEVKREDAGPEFDAAVAKLGGRARLERGEEELEFVQDGEKFKLPCRWVGAGAKPAPDAKNFARIWRCEKVPGFVVRSEANTVAGEAAEKILFLVKYWVEP